MDSLVSSMVNVHAICRDGKGSLSKERSDAVSGKSYESRTT